MMPARAANPETRHAAFQYIVRQDADGSSPGHGRQGPQSDTGCGARAGWQTLRYGVSMRPPSDPAGPGRSTVPLCKQQEPLTGRVPETRDSTEDRSRVRTGGRRHAGSIARACDRPGFPTDTPSNRRARKPPVLRRRRIRLGPRPWPLTPPGRTNRFPTIRVQRFRRRIGQTQERSRLREDHLPGMISQRAVENGAVAASFETGGNRTPQGTSASEAAPPMRGAAPDRQPPTFPTQPLVTPAPDTSKRASGTIQGTLLGFASDIGGRGRAVGQRLRDGACP